jgi:hypothetical protein
MYQSQMVAPKVTGTEAKTNHGVQGASIAFCKSCRCYGHQRRTSKKCTQNPRSKLYQGTYVDSVRRLLLCVVSKYSYFERLKRQYSPVVRFLVQKENSTAASEQRSDRAADCAPCADSNMTLKEQMAKLDDMELVDKNEDDLGKTLDEESRA